MPKQYHPLYHVFKDARLTLTFVTQPRFTNKIITKLESTCIVKQHMNPHYDSALDTVLSFILTDIKVVKKPI